MDKLVECLRSQMSEIELIQSMYPNPGDVVFTISSSVEIIRKFIDNQTAFVPNHLDFIINLIIDGVKIEVLVNLPSYYPEEKPTICIRCNALNRQEETSINFQLLNFINKNHLGDGSIYAILSWLQENFCEFYQKTQNQNVTETQYKDDKINTSLTRIWIHSHHIYNKKKREEIVKMAKEFNLTGFCLPGKPGIICIEGSDSDCKEWWKIIKSMSWKKIVIRKTEIVEQSELKFKNFQELQFPNASSRHSKHADMSGFSKYMEQCDLTLAFNEFLGLCTT